MQKQSFQNKQDLKQIENLVQKILKQIASIKEFQHSQLLKQKVQQFKNDFNKKSNQSVADHLKQPYKLSLLFKTEPKAQEQKVSSQSQQKSKKVVFSPPNIFYYTFQLPCLYETYEHMIKSQQIQKKVDDIITNYEVLKQIGKNECMTVQLIYLSYKRVMIIAPREFVYIRIFFKEQNQQNINVHWIVTFSVPYQSKGDKTRAEVIFTVQKIEQNASQKKINVQVYSEVDMKTAVKPDMAKNKGFSQIKKYIQKLYEYSKSKI